MNDEPVQACPPSTWYRFRKFARRNKAGLAVAGLVLFFIVLLGGGAGWAMRDRSAREEEVARDRAARQAKLNQEVEVALQEANAARELALSLTDNPYQWDAVLAAAGSACKRADGLAAQEEGGLDPAVHQRLEALRARLDADENDRRFVARFDEIRLEQTEIHLAVSSFKLEIAFPAFKKAFQTHYAIAFGATQPEKVLNVLEQRPLPVRQYLVAALDFSLPHVPKEDPQAREWLAAVLQAVDSSDPWRKQARAAMEAHDWQALSKLLEGRAAARQSPVVLVGLAARNPWDGDPRMLDLWRYIRQAYPGDFWANLWVAGVLHYRLQPPRSEEAIRYYTAAIALRPRCPATYADLGNALRSKGELDEAIAAYRQATALAPGYAGAHERLGLALEKKGCLDEAIAELRETIRFRNYLADHFVLGRLLERKGLHDEAIASYRKGIKTQPSNAADYNFLSWQLLVGPKELRGPKAALPLARKAVELQPQNGLFVNTLGVALFRNGELGTTTTGPTPGLSGAEASCRRHG